MYLDHVHLWIGQRILKKHDLDPLADKKFYWDSSQVKLATRLVKTTLKSIKWPVCAQRTHPWIGPKTHKNTISILSEIKSFTEITHKLSCLCSWENYAQKYVLSKVFTADTSLEWPKDSQKQDLDPLADKKHVIWTRFSFTSVCNNFLVIFSVQTYNKNNDRV